MELDFIMSLVSFAAIEEIDRELEPHIKDVLFCQRHEIILTSSNSTNQIDIGDAFARSVGLHLHFHVPFDVPSEDIMLEWFRLSIDELDDVRLARTKYLRYLASIQVERNSLEISVRVLNIEEEQVQFSL